MMIQKKKTGYDDPVDWPEGNFGKTEVLVNIAKILDM